MPDDAPAPAPAPAPAAAPEPPLVTFVVPSVGRATLRRALESLDAQTDRGFEAALVMDGQPAPGFAREYPWLRTIINNRRVGVKNHAGAVRNRAIDGATTEWLAFVDDDDTVSPRYVEMLRAESARRPGADAVLFRMRTDKAGRFRVLPPAGDDRIRRNFVGISFSARRLPLCLGGGRPFRFEPGGTEDFEALDALRRAGGEVAVSPSVAYFVEMPPEGSRRDSTGA